MGTSLAGKIAVVTGAGTGIGAGIARELAEAGADLMLHYRRHAGTTEDIAASCRDLGRRAEIIGGDFAEDPEIAAYVVLEAARRLGQVDILVNNAAFTDRTENVQTLSKTAFEEVMRVNVTAVFLGSQAAARHMIERASGGRIVNIGSIHMRIAAPSGRTAYEASKGALASLTSSLAVALGPHGITVNCVAPGAVVVERYAELDLDQEWYVTRTPVGRMGRPADVASLVRFLCGDEAGFITGETIFVDGGVLRRSPLAK